MISVPTSPLIYVNSFAIGTAVNIDATGLLSHLIGVEDISDF